METNKGKKGDYVYNAKDIAYYKEIMERESDLLKQEKKENQDLVPGVD